MNTVKLATNAFSQYTLNTIKRVYNQVIGSGSGRVQRSGCCEDDIEDKSIFSRICETANMGVEKVFEPIGWFFANPGIEVIKNHFGIWEYEKRKHLYLATAIIVVDVLQSYLVVILESRWMDLSKSFDEKKELREVLAMSLRFMMNVAFYALSHKANMKLVLQLKASLYSAVKKETLASFLKNDAYSTEAAKKNSLPIFSRLANMLASTVTLADSRFKTLVQMITAAYTLWRFGSYCVVIAGYSIQLPVLVMSCLIYAKAYEWVQSGSIREAKDAMRRINATDKDLMNWLSRKTNNSLSEMLTNSTAQDQLVLNKMDEEQSDSFEMEASAESHIKMLQVIHEWLQRCTPALIVKIFGLPYASYLILGESMRRFMGGSMWSFSNSTALARLQNDVQAFKNYRTELKEWHTAMSSRKLVLPRGGKRLELHKFSFWNKVEGKKVYTVRDTELELEDKRYLLEGPSGSGKSSLIYAALAKKLKIRGTVIIPEGYIVVPQTPNLPNTEMTLLELILGKNKASEEEINKVIEILGELLINGFCPSSTKASDVEMKDFKEKLNVSKDWADSLSGGEQKKIALVRSLRDVWTKGKFPPLLILDEVTSAMDSTHQFAVEKWIDSIIPRGSGVTIISTQHHPHVWPDSGESFHDSIITFDTQQFVISPDKNSPKKKKRDDSPLPTAGIDQLTSQRK